MLVKKESLILLGIILLLVMSSISSFADFQQTTDVSGVQPKFTHIFLLSTATRISNGTATISTSFQTYDADSVELEITLQKYVSGHWFGIKTWNRTSSGPTIYSNELYAVYSGYMYRSVVTGYAYIDGSMVESATEISDVIDY